MELMIPINRPAYAGNWVFVSLYSNYLYLYITLNENTSYFPKVNNYKKSINYQEIQPPNLTVALTAKYENKVPIKSQGTFGAEYPLIMSHSRNLDSAWGI
jgi:hypothetical protein